MKVTKTGKWSEGCSALGMTCKVPQNCDFNTANPATEISQFTSNSAASQPFSFFPHLRHWRMEQSLDKPSRSRCFLVWKLLALPIAPWSWIKSDWSDWTNPRWSQKGLKQETSNTSFTDFCVSFHGFGESWCLCLVEVLCQFSLEHLHCASLKDFRHLGAAPIPSMNTLKGVSRGKSEGSGL